MLAGLLLALWAAPAEAIRWPWEKRDPWPDTSERPVTVLEHPSVERWLASHDPTEPYRFALYGDQRALADGEWQELIAAIVAESKQRDFAFVMDSGDILSNGEHADQWFLLRNILEPLRPWPYLVGLGNHEVTNNRKRISREHAAAFLSYLDPSIHPDRFYYRKDLGAATFLFLDTNDFVYGEHGDRKECPLEVDPDTREGQQLRWLRDQIADLSADPPPVTIAVMHHPLVQTSTKHLQTACSLWNFQDRGETLMDLLADGGVDVVIVGHTHTYERFRMVRRDGHEMHVVNVSGRPRNRVLWWGARERRAEDIRGQESAWFDEVGFVGLADWGIQQEDLMLPPEENQYAVFTVEPDGGIVLEMRFLDDDEPLGARHEPAVRLR